MSFVIVVACLSVFAALVWEKNLRRMFHSWRSGRPDRIDEIIEKKIGHLPPLPLEAEDEATVKEPHITHSGNYSYRAHVVPVYTRFFGVWWKYIIDSKYRTLDWERYKSIHPRTFKSRDRCVRMAHAWLDGKDMPEEDIGGSTLI